MLRGTNDLGKSSSKSTLSLVALGAEIREISYVSLFLPQYQNRFISTTSSALFLISFLPLSLPAHLLLPLLDINFASLPTSFEPFFSPPALCGIANLYVQNIHHSTRRPFVMASFHLETAADHSCQTRSRSSCQLLRPREQLGPLVPASSPVHHPPRPRSQTFDSPGHSGSQQTPSTFPVDFGAIGSCQLGLSITSHPANWESYRSQPVSGNPQLLPLDPDNTRPPSNQPGNDYNNNTANMR
jgi:hypothetical protein